VQLKYKPDGDTLKTFMKDDSFFRGLRGPVGSGKSVACCIEIFRRALMQKPNEDGIKKSRWAVIRNTNPQLRTTTIKTWLDWFPENDWGNFRWSVPFTHHIKKGNIDVEVIFLALDRPEDVKKLLSLELTGIWVNEAREIPKSIIDACTMRVGRFPSMKDGGPTWYGVICDTNAPEEDHWWAIMSGDSVVPEHISREEALMLVKPDNWMFWNQPGGMVENRNNENEIIGYKSNDKAENKKHLTPEYYKNIVNGKTKSWIDIYVMNRLGRLDDGKPVYPDFNKLIHVADEHIPVANGNTVYVGMDFGLTPAAVFAQKIRGRWHILKEVVCIDMGIVRFAELMRQEIAQNYQGCDLQMWGDPAGDFRAQTDESTPFQIMRGAGVQVYPAPSNDVSLRLESVNAGLTRMLEGQSGVLIDKRCKELIAGFDGGYHYRRLQVTGQERYQETPNKNRFSHVHDALQYLMLGSGEGRGITHGNALRDAFQVKASFNPFDKKRARKKEKSFWSKL